MTTPEEAKSTAADDSALDQVSGGVLLRRDPNRPGCVIPKSDDDDDDSINWSDFYYPNMPSM